MMTTESKRKHQKQKSSNALVKAIASFSEDLLVTSPSSVNTLSNVRFNDPDIPKRYTIYEPMLLLPSNFTTHSPQWQAFYSSLTELQRRILFNAIARAFCSIGQHITHIAQNAPIDQTVSSGSLATVDENFIRSPANLQPLYGDFGPAWLQSAQCQSHLVGKPTQKDFEAALWVETSQVGGIKQVWAPRWTMFSRGNVREKARILGRSQQQHETFFPGMNREELDQAIEDIDIVDMYIGIGYFAIPYLKRGVRRVFGWEINGWSVEGLRRGCERNGFSCEVIPVEDTDDTTQRSRIAARVLSLLKQHVFPRCVVFQGDNRYAADVLNEIREGLSGHAAGFNVRHCNLGLLPTSSGSWANAVKLISTDRGGWLHVHENADISQVEAKRQAVVDSVTKLAQQFHRPSWLVSCQHTEMVKTYAPGVGHFVFDLNLQPSR